MKENTLGKRLRQVRRMQDLTQQQLAEKAGVNFTTISRIETGDYRQLYWQTVRDLAEALDVSLDWIDGREEGEPAAAPPAWPPAPAPAGRR